MWCFWLFFLHCEFLLVERGGGVLESAPKLGRLSENPYRPLGASCGPGHQRDFFMWGSFLCVFLCAVTFCWWREEEVVKGVRSQEGATVGQLPSRGDELGAPTAPLGAACGLGRQGRGLHHPVRGQAPVQHEPGGRHSVPLPINPYTLFPSVLSAHGTYTSYTLKL